MSFESGWWYQGSTRGWSRVEYKIGPPIKGKPGHVEARLEKKADASWRVLSLQSIVRGSSPCAPMIRKRKWSQVQPTAFSDPKIKSASEIDTFDKALGWLMTRGTKADWERVVEFFGHAGAGATGFRHRERLPRKETELSTIRSEMINRLPMVFDRDNNHNRIVLTVQELFLERAHKMGATAARSVLATLSGLPVDMSIVSQRRYDAPKQTAFVAIVLVDGVGGYAATTLDRPIMHVDPATNKISSQHVWIPPHTIFSESISCDSVPFLPHLISSAQQFYAGNVSGGDQVLVGYTALHPPSLQSILNHRINALVTDSLDPCLPPVLLAIVRAYLLPKGILPRSAASNNKSTKVSI